LARLITVDFRNGWAKGLSDLLAKLDEDKVSKKANFTPDAVTSWWKTQFAPDKGSTSVCIASRGEVVAHELNNVAMIRKISALILEPSFFFNSFFRRHRTRSDIRGPTLFMVPHRGFNPSSRSCTAITASQRFPVRAGCANKLTNLVRGLLQSLEFSGSAEISNFGEALRRPHRSFDCDLRATA
jgi:hypothetical protein